MESRVSTRNEYSRVEITGNKLQGEQEQKRGTYGLGPDQGAQMRCQNTGSDRRLNHGLDIEE